MMKDSFTLKQYFSFSWYAISDLLPTDSIPNYLQYALHKLNLFQLLFIFFLSFLLKKDFNDSIQEALKAIISIYVPALLVWLTFVTFIVLLLM